MSATRVKKNIIANYLGTGWNMVLSLLFVPFYIRILGIEAYGLIGFFASLQAFLAILDLGIGQTLTREIARLSGTDNSSSAMRSTVKTFGVLYWAIAVAIGGIFAALAPFFAAEWLNTSQIQEKTLVISSLLVALSITLRWPGAIYATPLSALQRQTELNLIRSGGVTIRGVGAVLILKYVSPSITAFFAWQAVANLVTTLCFALAANAVLPKAKTPFFDFNIVKRLWRYAAGFSAISILSLILTQTDKIILTRMLPLQEFGYYTVAGTLAGIILHSVAPIVNAVYPRITQLVGASNECGLRSVYHSAAQLVSLLVLPLGITLATNSRDVLLLWTRDPEIVRNAWLILSVLVLGHTMNSFMHIPYFTQLAHGWTSLTIKVNLCAICLIVPLIILFAGRWGSAGAAGAWLVLNLGYVLIVPSLMHRRLLRGEKIMWYFKDIGLPAVLLLLIGYGLRYLLPESNGFAVALFRIGISYVVTFAAATLLLPMTRRFSIRFFNEKVLRCAQ